MYVLPKLWYPHVRLHGIITKSYKQFLYNRKMQLGGTGLTTSKRIT
jgi:hypothetical protein